MLINLRYPSHTSLNPDCVLINFLRFHQFLYWQVNRVVLVMSKSLRIFVNDFCVLFNACGMLNNVSEMYWRQGVIPVVLFLGNATLRIGARLAELHEESTTQKFFKSFGPFW